MPRCRVDPWHPSSDHVINMWPKAEMHSVAGVFICILLGLAIGADAIGCFQCTSVNKGNSACEDSFNNTDDKYYISDCWASRSGRHGLFPATECIKMIASDESTGFSLVVRDCVVDNGGTNSETEIGRQSHCGWMREIQYDEKRMKGCILTCNSDGCNGASGLSTLHVQTLFMLVLVTMLVRWNLFGVRWQRNHVMVAMVMVETFWWRIGKLNQTLCFQLVHAIMMVVIYRLFKTNVSQLCQTGTLVWYVLTNYVSFLPM